MAMPLVSVILCTYNRSQLLPLALADLAAQRSEGSFELEIVVVDDRSTDDTPALVAERARSSPVPIRYVQGEGRGYTRALNCGLAAARGEWLAFFDDDQRTDPSWCRELLAAALAQDAPITGGAIVLDLPPETAWDLGPHCRRLLGEHPVGNPPPEEILPAGGNRIIRRSVFERIGGFDESFLTGGCDLDLLYRARRAGIAMGWAPRAVVRHHIPRERLDPSRLKWYCMQSACAFAVCNWRADGAARALAGGVGRIGKALLVNAPLLLLARLRRDEAEILDRSLCLWRVNAYARKILSLVAPRLFRQQDFFARMNFRKRT